MDPATGRTWFARARRQPTRATALTVVLLAAPIVLAQSYLISSVPMVVPSALEPNIIVSLDDAPGMANAFPSAPAFAALPAVPDGVTTSVSTAPASTRRFESSPFDATYYNQNAQYVAPTGARSTATSFAQALIDGDHIGGGDVGHWRVDPSSGYRPTLSCDASGNTQSFADHAAADLGMGANQVGTTGATGNAAGYYYYVNDATLAGCTSSIGDDSCYRLQRGTASSGPNGADEGHNFANWHSSYRTRHPAMASSAWRVMSDPKPAGTRVAWQALNSCNSFATGSNRTGHDAGSPNVSNCPNLVDEFSHWPAPSAGSTGRAYDLWHAALNCRGEFFGADAPEQVAAAMNAALARTIDQANVGATLAPNSTRLTTESLLYQASLDTRGWTGRLRAIRVNTDGSLGADVRRATAGSNIPAAASRRIFTSSGAAGSGIDFTWAALGAAGLQPRIGDEATLNFLRGDRSGEIASGGAFRDRGVRFGDIVNSQIAFSGREDFGYKALVVTANGTVTGEGLAYPPYRLSKATRTKLVIVGANDGMLHGFDADTGAEKFAYVPRALLLDPISGSDARSRLVRLVDPAYTHRYYVDGSPWVGDAYWGGAWRTVVVGTAGAGGKGVFALDITAPNSLTAAHVLWDLEGQSDPDLGYTIGQAVIGRLHDGHFYAIFGNGYKSSNECPLLYLVRLHDGLVRKIPAGGRALAARCASAPNGLGRPSLYDSHVAGAEGHRITDYVYAGDLQGNLWRFDLRSVNLSADPATRWSVQLLFTARNAANEVQPIAGTIEIGTAPSEVTAPAALLWFGTGRYCAVDDRVDTTVQSMYGIVDRFGTGSQATVARSTLATQTINVNSGTITGTAVSYAAAGSGRRDGWFVDLPRAGERMVGLPLVQRGRLIFPTLIPDDDKCAGGGSSSIMALDSYHGFGLAQRIFLAQSAVDFIASTVGIVRNLVDISTGTHAYLYAGGASGSVQVEAVRPLQQAAGRGRVSWREIVR